MKINSRYTSIIIANFSSSPARVASFKTSMSTLINTTSNLPVEIIVCDNGGDFDVSSWLLSLVDQGKIHTYVRNARNMHFGMARNQGISLSHGNYVVIADNDIQYSDGWLEMCLEILEAYPDEKIYATPLDYPTPVMFRRYHKGELELNGKKYQLSLRAGSNCFVIRRKDLDEIGWFMNHRVAGTKWTDAAVRKGYLAAVSPETNVFDAGFRVGYDLNESIPIKKTLTNGEEIHFNQDEFRKANPDLNYYE